MTDWNGNGEHDAFDDYVNYQMISGDDNETGSYGHSKRSGSLKAFIIILGISLIAEVCMEGLGVFILVGLYLLRLLFT